jgi:hypothetical protein
VRVATLKRGVLEKSVVAYGTLGAPASATRVLSLPMEVDVRAVRLAIGMPVGPDTVICEVGLTPDSQSARKEAIAARDGAKAALSQAQERLGLHLATATDVQQAEQALALAEPKAAMWSDRPDALIDVRAGVAGVLTELDAQVGKIVPSGAALAEVSGRQLEVRLGCEPADAIRIVPDQPVQVVVPRRPDLPALAGHVLAVSRSITPESRLQDAVVGVDSATDELPMGEIVTGRLRLPLPEAWVIPRDALVLGEQPAVFTIVDGKAARHLVLVVGVVGAECAITAADLKPSDRIIVQGSYEVEDGMAVAIESGP